MPLGCIDFCAGRSVECDATRGPSAWHVHSARVRIQPRDSGTDFAYTGELGTDLWRLGTWWGDRVAPSWEQTVATSLEGVRTEAEHRAGHAIGHA